MRLSIRGKLVLLSLGILVVVSFALTFVHLRITRTVVEEDLAERAVVFAQEIAATIGDVRELESGPLMQRQVEQILRVRRSVLQLDMLTFTGGPARVVATSHPQTRLPFTRAEVERVQRGEVVSRLVREETQRYWEVIAPVTLETGVAGAVAAKFSLARADAVCALLLRIATGATSSNAGATDAARGGADLQAGRRGEWGVVAGGGAFRYTV